MAQVAGACSDQFLLSSYGTSPGDDGWFAQYGKGGLCIDGVRVHAGSNQQWALAGVANDTFEIASRLGSNGVYHLSLASGFALRDHTLRQFGAFLHSAINLTDVDAVAISIMMADDITLSALLESIATMFVVGVDTVGLSETTVVGKGVTCSDILVTLDSNDVVKCAVCVLQDAVMTVESWTPLFSFVEIGRDDVMLSEDLGINAVYHLLLRDHIEFLLDMIDPGGGLTAWAMNARSGDTTEYTNWSFNSYAKLGDTYIAASPDGVFELTGDRDGETPIVSSLRNGLMELTGSHLTGLKAAYVAVRGEGVFYLKLEGGGRSVVYRITANSKQTARVNLGKGWRARYLTWELVSTGQNFDLMGLEFLPFPSTRRVGR